MECKPQPHGWHWAQRGGKIEMVLAGPEYAGKVWNPIRRQQFNVSEFERLWQVPMPDDVQEINQ